MGRRIPVVEARIERIKGTDNKKEMQLSVWGLDRFPLQHNPMT